MATALVIAYAGPQSGNFLYKSNAFFFQLAIYFLISFFVLKF
jgi:hypothetical protein